MNEKGAKQCDKKKQQHKNKPNMLIKDNGWKKRGKKEQK